VRNACLDQIETTIGTGPLLKIFSGAVPVNCAAADPSGLLATITLPSDWMANARVARRRSRHLVGGRRGQWHRVELAALRFQRDRLPRAGHLRPGSGDLSLDNTNIAAGQTVTVNSFTITKGNA